MRSCERRPTGATPPGALNYSRPTLIHTPTHTYICISTHTHILIVPPTSSGSSYRVIGGAYSTLHASYASRSREEPRTNAAFFFPYIHTVKHSYHSPLEDVTSKLETTYDSLRKFEFSCSSHRIYVYTASPCLLLLLLLFLSEIHKCFIGQTGTHCYCCHSYGTATFYIARQFEFYAPINSNEIRQI